MATRREQQAKDRFSERYREQRADVVRTIEHTVIGGDWGANGYTTIAKQTSSVRYLPASTARCCSTSVQAGLARPTWATMTGCSVVDRRPDEGLSVARRTKSRRGRAQGSSLATSTPTPCATCRSGRHVRRRCHIGAVVFNAQLPAESFLAIHRKVG